MTFLGLGKEELKQLEFEVISERARLKLTRLIRSYADSGDKNTIIINQNAAINIANQVLARPIYLLEPDLNGNYEPVEFGWHQGEIELIMRRPSTSELVETLADLIQRGIMDLETVNEILKQDNSSVRFKYIGTYFNEVKVNVLPIESVEEVEDTEEHPNIRKLINRMDTQFSNADYSAVLHSSASVFETLAKIVFKSPTVQNKSLGGFFAGYRKKSNLLDPVLDYIENIYDLRSKEPLAAHGSTLPENITKEEAIFLVELTKTFVRIERKLAVNKLDVS